MIQVRYISDLHIDQPYFDKFDLPIMDNEIEQVLIIAGDVAEQMQPVEWIESIHHRFAEVLYVPGNHEYYNSHMYSQLHTLKTALQPLGNVHVLDCDTFIYKDVVFIGATLWTNFEKGKPLSLYLVGHSMNDFRCITVGNPCDSTTFTSQNAFDLHQQHLSYITDQLIMYKDKPCVVISHHAPSYNSVHQNFIGDSINGGFVSDLDYMFYDHPNIKYWVHGHVHSDFEYKLYHSTVVCNPRGYHRKLRSGQVIKEQLASNFDATRFFEIEGY